MTNRYITLISPSSVILSDCEWSRQATMDESGMNFSSGKETDPKDHTAYDPSYKKYTDPASPEIKYTSCCPELGV